MAGPDPYRALFHQLATAAAHCRLIVERDQVVGVEVLDANAALAGHRAVLPQLLPALARVCAAGAPETIQLRRDPALLAVTVYPVATDEAMVTLEDVTAREQLEQRSRASQGRFEQVFHGNAAAMVIAHQRDLRIIDVNPRWLELFGATRDEVIGRTSVELGLISESTAQARIAQHQRFVDGYDIELELRTRAGAKLVVLASAKPIEIAEGRCTLTTLIDITGRKHAEEAFAVAFSASPAGMMLVEVGSDMVVAVNNRLLEMIGERRDQLVGRRASELTLIVHPARDVLLAEIERTGRLDSVEVELACKGGPGVWTLASTELITLRDKVHRLSVFTDIAGRKRFERRLLTQHVIGSSLAETSGLEVAIPHVLEALCRGEGWHCGAVWLPGASGAFACVASWHAAELADDFALQVRARELATDPLFARLRDTGAPEKIALCGAALGPLAAAAVAVGMRDAVAFPILRGHAVLGAVALAARDGQTVLDAAERGLFDSVGRLLGLFVERVGAEVALRELNVELEQRVLDRTRALETSNRDLEAFSFSISHDLRAPLRAIHGFSGILLDDFAPVLPDEARALIGRIHAGGERLRHLIEDLLAFARLGRHGLRRTEIAIDPLVRSVLDELLVGRGLDDRLELRVAPLGTCHADPTLLRPVWTNLIDNALKYARTRARIVIEIGRELRGTEIVYYVRDNGVGFDMAHAEHLVGGFQRLHPGHEFEGTGIGLANVRRIVEHHRGWVAAHSELGRGSTFEFALGTER